MNTDFEPVIKWSGSKNTAARGLSALLPFSGRFYDPFVGGGSLLPYRSPQPATAGDVIPELIDLWHLVRDSPDVVINEYATRWLRLQSEGHTAYYAIRESFNQQRNPFDLLFLTRTCVNGLIRFNSQGDFNNSLHHTRPGIAPERFARIARSWSRALQHVELHAADYRVTMQSARRGDVAFFDPPYAGNQGRYRRDPFDLGLFFGELDRLSSLGVRWLLTFDGRAGARMYREEIPRELYRIKLGLPTGHSPFTRLMRTTLDPVTESVYLNFDPPSEAIAQFHDLIDSGGQRVRSHDVENTSIFSVLKLDCEG